MLQQVDLDILQNSIYTYIKDEYKQNEEYLYSSILTKYLTTY